MDRSETDMNRSSICSFLHMESETGNLEPAMSDSTLLGGIRTASETEAVPEEMVKRASSASQDDTPAPPHGVQFLVIKHPDLVDVSDDSSLESTPSPSPRRPFAKRDTASSKRDIDPSPASAPAAMTSFPPATDTPRTSMSAPNNSINNQGLRLQAARVKFANAAGRSFDEPEFTGLTRRPDSYDQPYVRNEGFAKEIQAWLSVSFIASPVSSNSQRLYVQQQQIEVASPEAEATILLTPDLTRSITEESYSFEAPTTPLIEVTASLLDNVEKQKGLTPPPEAGTTSFGEMKARLLIDASRSSPSLLPYVRDPSEASPGSVIDVRT